MMQLQLSQHRSQVALGTICFNYSYSKLTEEDGDRVDNSLHVRCMCYLKLVGLHNLESDRFNFPLPPSPLNTSEISKKKLTPNK